MKKIIKIRGGNLGRVVKGKARATLAIKNVAPSIPLHLMLYALLIRRNFKAVSALS